MALSLKALKIDFEGSIEDALRLPLTAVPEIRTVFSGSDMSSLWTQGRGRYLEEIESIFVGGYGIVYELNVYEKQEGGRLKFLEKVYEKRSKAGGTGLFVEACLQILAGAKLTELGFGHAIAQTRDILRWPDGEISFTMTPFLDVKNLHEMMADLTGAGLKGRAFDVWFIPIFVQIVVLMGLLEEHVGLNHRDLKGDNILISTEGRQRSAEVTLGGQQWSFIYRQPVHVIDFGFACRGPADQGSASASSGSFFSARATCPKGGRDVFVLLCYFYGTPAFRAAASAPLLEFVRGKIGNEAVLRHLEEHGTRRTKYIYFLLGSADFSTAGCCVGRLLGELVDRWPALIARA